MLCHSERALATEESAQPREILQSPRLPQDDMNAVEFGKLFSRAPLTHRGSCERRVSIQTRPNPSFRRVMVSHARLFAPEWPGATAPGP
jgi:hypothetical protein